MARDNRVILDDDDPPPRHAMLERETSRFAYEWGLASSLIGSTFLIMGPVALLFCLTFWNHGREEHGLSMRDLQLTEIGSIVCVAGAELLGATGLIFGLRGLGRARQSHQPAALPLAGIMLCAAAMVMWLIVAIDLLMIVNTFIRWKEY